MYYKIFILGENTQRMIEKAGFTTHSVQEVKTFYGDKEENVTCLPKDYFFDGSVWVPVDIDSMYERLLLLARRPLLPFQELWRLFFSRSREDQFGALVEIVAHYIDDVLAELKINRSNYRNNRKIRRKMLRLKEHALMLNGAKSKQIISAIEEILTVF